MQTNIKLVAIDLDGTFLTDQKEVLRENVEAVHAVIEKGIQVVVCTGRTLPGTRRFIEAIGFSGNEEYLILQNGAVTHRLPDYSILDATYQNVADRKSLIDFFFDQRVDSLQLVAFDQEHLYLINDQEANAIVKADAKTLATEVTSIDSEAFLAIDGIFKMMVLGPKEDLDQWAQTITSSIKNQFDVVRSQPIIIEFLTPAINKAAALKKLCQSLNISKKEVMALGDENNDLEMLKWAKYSIAMGNAIENVKAICFDQTDSNNQAGVAKALKKHILI